MSSFIEKHRLCRVLGLWPQAEKTAEVSRMTGEHSEALQGLTFPHDLISFHSLLAVPYQPKFSKAREEVQEVPRLVVGGNEPLTRGSCLYERLSGRWRAWRWGRKGRCKMTGRSWKLLPLREERASTQELERVVYSGLCTVNEVQHHPVKCFLITLFGFCNIFELNRTSIYRSVIFYLKRFGPDIFDFRTYQTLDT